MFGVFFRKWRDKPFIKAILQDVLSQLEKVQLLNNFSKGTAISTKKLGQTLRTHMEEFLTTVFAFGFLGCYLGTDQNKST